MPLRPPLPIIRVPIAPVTPHINVLAPSHVKLEPTTTNTLNASGLTNGASTTLSGLRPV